METNQSILLEPIPAYVRVTDTLSLIESGTINSKYIMLLKHLTILTDDIISGWLNMNVKTFRSYKNTQSEIKPNIQEHTVMLLSLMKHGIEVFGDKYKFSQWLETDNMLLGNRKPSSFLNTTSGVKYIDDRLTGMEFGDNV